MLRDAETIDEWVDEELGGEDDDAVSEDSAARIARRVEREIRRLVRSNEIEPGKVVSLLDSPHPFLSSAPLLDGRWIDVIALELAELGVYPRGQRLHAARVPGPAYPRLGGVRPDRCPGRTLTDRPRLLA